MLTISVTVTVWLAPRFVGKGADVQSRIVGHPAPLFELEDLQDPSRTVGVGPSNRRLTVVNFWASWCAPCQREMPALERVRTVFATCVEFVGVDHNDTRADALDLVRKTGVGYHSGFDPNGQVATAYGLIGLPTTIIIGRDGTVKWVHLGAVEGDQLVQRLERMGAATGC